MKIFFFVLICLNITTSYACKFSPDYLMKAGQTQRGFFINPESAKYIFVGNVYEDKVNRGDQLFMPEKSLNAITDKPFVVSTGPCYTTSFYNGRYLLLSNELKDYNMMYLGSISKTSKLMERLSNMKSFVGEINFAWQFCNADSDCKAVKNKCSNTYSINKKNEGLFLEREKVTDIKTCIVQKKKTLNKCIENMCE